MNALSPLTYAEAHSGVSEIVSKLGLPLFMGEAERKPTVKALRKQVGAYYNSLAKENQLDCLHAYDAVDKAELIENAVAELLERVEG
tara:strand:+ start:56 stop:316 length:261 start_codon:yes stop_codon:yes gene_type:complete